jgi:hypothetical protein
VEGLREALRNACGADDNKNEESIA